MSRTELLPRQISDVDRVELAEELVALHQDLHRIDQELADARRSARDQKKELKERLGEIIATLTAGTEDREVEVIDVQDTQFGMLRTIRADDGTVVRERPLTQAERQLRLREVG